MLRRSYFMYFIIATMTLWSCSKEDSVIASVEGYDLRLCGCCGGLLVKPADGNGDIYQWHQKNGNFGVSIDDTFPLKVRIKYHHLAQSCVASDGEIEITALERIK